MLASKQSTSKQSDNKKSNGAKSNGTKSNRQTALKGESIIEDSAATNGELAEKGELVEKRGRGRPKGTGGNKRPDSTAQLAPGENRKYLEHDLKMWDWPKVDMTKPEAVSERIGNYFRICAEDDMKPSVAGMALAFGVDRKTLWCWCNGVDSKYVTSESRTTLKKAYHFLNSQMENYMQNGKINPVAGIFLMKNNMGYTDKQEVVVTPNNPMGTEGDQAALAEKYKDAIEVDE